MKEHECISEIEYQCRIYFKNEIWGWRMEIMGGEYSEEILYCPYCGVKLDGKF